MSENISETVAEYMMLRENKERMTREFEADVKIIQDAMDTLKHKMLATCNAMGLDSFKTDAGTVVRQLKERYYGADWDVLYKFIVENNVPHLLEKRVAQGNMKLFINEVAETPPGVQVHREYDVVVRKPS